MVDAKRGKVFDNGVEHRVTSVGDSCASEYELALLTPEGEVFAQASIRWAGWGDLPAQYQALLDGLDQGKSLEELVGEKGLATAREARRKNLLERLDGEIYSIRSNSRQAVEALGRATCAKRNCAKLLEEVRTLLASDPECPAGAFCSCPTTLKKVVEQAEELLAGELPKPE